MDLLAVWDFDDPAESEAKFRSLLPTGDAGIDAEVTTQIARSLGLQLRFEEARLLISTVREAQGRALVRYHLEKGRIANSSGDPKASIPDFEQAFQLAEELGEEYLVVDAAHMLGIVEEPVGALDWNYRAIGMAEAASDENARGWLGSLYNNTGWTLHGQGRFNEARSLFEKALAFRVEQGKAGPIRVAKWSVGRCLRSLGRIDEAFEIQYELLKRKHDGCVCEELGELQLVRGRSELAAKWFGRAYEELSQDPWLSADEPERLDRMKGLAESIIPIEERNYGCNETRR
ncbi:MAG: tetratricopeptide repeat protein [Fimbriimonadales bacterium]